MGIFRKFEKHGELMGAMMRRTGALDDERMLRVSDGALRNAFYRCQSCRHSEACEHFLQNAEAAEPTPGFCENKALMDSLAR